MKKNKRALLEALLNGNIDAREFLNQVRKPEVVICLVDSSLKPGQTEPSPDARTTLTSIGGGRSERKQMAWRDYLAYREKNPDITFSSPILFVRSGDMD